MCRWMARLGVSFVEVKRVKEDRDMKSRTNSIHDWSQSLSNTVHYEGLSGGVTNGLRNVARCALRACGQRISDMA